MVDEGIEPNPGPLGWKKLLKKLQKELGDESFETLDPILEKAKKEFELDSSHGLLAVIAEKKIQIKYDVVKIIQKLDSSGTFNFHLNISYIKEKPVKFRTVKVNVMFLKLADVEDRRKRKAGNFSIIY